MRTYLNDNWQYFSTWTEDIFSADGGQDVRLPHTNIEIPFNCFSEKIYQFVSGYKRNLHLDKVEGTYLLTFEGVAHYCEVFVNERLVATHSCGYTAFTVDITEQLRSGNNQVVVKVDSREALNQPPFGFVIDYLTYGGIYREVWLDNYVGCYVSDAFVTASPQKPLTVALELAKFDAPCRLSAEILDGIDVVAKFDWTAEKRRCDFQENVDLQTWDLQNPKVYTLKIAVDGNIYQTNFGVRKAEFTPEGFFLNGKKVKIVGLNRHQSFPYVGYAMPESMQRRDAQLLKHTLCVNAVRTSHYPQSHYFLDECDRQGLLVFTEIPGWQHIGDGKWKDIAVRNVKEMVLQYRNHPSIVLWGVRINESLDDDELYEKTNEVAHTLDPTRQTGGVRYLMKSHLLEDVYTFNDFNNRGATNRDEVCDKNVPFMVSEYNGHMYPTKPYDDFPHRQQHVLKYAHMLDGFFQSTTTCGAFGWCMFDYNTHKDFGSGDRICYHGVMDMFRNPKMAAGIFASFGQEKPFLDVTFTADKGDYPEGNMGQLFCLTNADSVELVKDNRVVRTFTHQNSPYKYLPNAPILIDDLIGDRLTVEEGIEPKYAKKIKEVIADINRLGLNNLKLPTKLKIASIMKGTGLTLGQLVDIYKKYESNWGSETSAFTFRAVKDGKVVAEKTVGCVEELTLEVTVSSHVLHEGTTYDVAAVNFRMLDQNGNVVPYIAKILHFKTEGAVTLIGPDELALSGGMGGTFVKTTGQKGTGSLIVDDKTIQFEVK